MESCLYINQERTTFSKEDSTNKDNNYYIMHTSALYVEDLKFLYDIMVDYIIISCGSTSINYFCIKASLQSGVHEKKIKKNKNKGTLFFFFFH